MPETYHSITSVGGTGDVNKVDVKLFPYAGQDLNNGYTKINISTSKPVTLSANVKTAGKQAPHIDSKKLAQLDSAFDGKPTSYSNVQTKPAKPVVKPEPVKTESVKPAVKPVQTNETVKLPEILRLIQRLKNKNLFILLQTAMK